MHAHSLGHRKKCSPDIILIQSIRVNICGFFKEGPCCAMQRRPKTSRDPDTQQAVTDAFAQYREEAEATYAGCDAFKELCRADCNIAESC